MWRSSGRISFSIASATAPFEPGREISTLPGSKGAVVLAMEKLILPELRHMVSQLQGK